MTEDEVKTKWCPQVARDPRDGDSISTGQCCIGSACMAWRWESTATNDRVIAVKQRRIDTGCDFKSAIDWVNANPATAENGYCGLAGKP